MRGEVGANSKGEPRLRLYPENAEERELLLRYDELHMVMDAFNGADVLTDVTFKPAALREGKKPLDMSHHVAKDDEGDACD